MSRHSRGGATSGELWILSRAVRRDGIVCGSRASVRADGAIACKSDASRVGAFALESAILGESMRPGRQLVGDAVIMHKQSVFVSGGNLRPREKGWQNIDGIYNCSDNASIKSHFGRCYLSAEFDFPGRCKLAQEH